MAFTKISLLEKAVKITESYAKGGGNTPPQVVLKDLYEQLKELNEELDK